ncbi:MAG: hypothetical protein LCH51_09505 [Bacteroidetes bacterium]|nr:hypothetical protein [Bacteroidota bacterium]
MKKITGLFLLALTSLAGAAQQKTTSTAMARLQAIEDRIAIKNIVDTFSVLADQKKHRNKPCCSPKMRWWSRALRDNQAGY